MESSFVIPDAHMAGCTEHKDVWLIMLFQAEEDARDSQCRAHRAMPSKSIASRCSPVRSVNEDNASRGVTKERRTTWRARSLVISAAAPPFGDSILASRCIYT